MELNELIDLHLEAYAESDSARRKELLAQAWSPEGDLADPPIEGRGYAGIAKMAEATVTAPTLAMTSARPSG